MVWQVFHASQKICPASPRHYAECPLASLPHFARDRAASCAPVPGPPVLRLPDQVWAAGFCFVGARSQNTSDNSGLSVRCSTLEPERTRRPSQLEDIGAIEAASLNRRRRETLASAGVIDGAQRKECPMIRYLAAIGTLAVFVSAPAMAQQPT